MNQTKKWFVISIFILAQNLLYPIYTTIIFGEHIWVSSEVLLYYAIVIPLSFVTIFYVIHVLHHRFDYSKMLRKADWRNTDE